MINRHFFIVFVLLLSSCNLFSQTIDLTYQYDPLNRLTLVTYPDGTQIQYEYDELGNRLSKTVVMDCPVATGIMVTNVTETTATVGWMNTGFPGGNSVSFDVLTSTDGTNFSPVATALTVTTFDLTELTAGTNYFVRIQTNCNSGTDNASAPVAFATLQDFNNGGGNTGGTIGDCDDPDDDDEDPIFLNCPTTPYVFGINNAIECAAYANWSIPVAS